jgi:hypothetical protein
MKFDFTSEEMYILSDIIREKLEEKQKDPLWGFKKGYTGTVLKSYFDILKNIQHRLDNNG